jgi:hypothetical protein
MAALTGSNLYGQPTTGQTTTSTPDPLTGLFGGAITSGLSPKKLKKLLENQAKAKIQAQTAGMQQAAFARSEQALRQGMRGTDKAFQDAKLQAARGAEMARQQVKEYGKAQGAQSTQSMMNRGLYGTTVQDQAQRAVSSDVARNLGLINTQLAQQQGELGIAQAGAKQSALGQIAQLYPQLAGMQTDTMFKFMSSLKTKKKPSLFGKILGAAGGILGTMIAPGIGTAIGGALGGMAGGGGDQTQGTGYNFPGTFVGEKVY